jgi:ribosomal protein S18 acetylase RimI-like enzyme
VEEAREEPAQSLIDGLTRRQAVPADAAIIIGWFPSRRDAVWWGGPTVADPLTAAWLLEQFAAGTFWVWTDRSGVIQAMAGMKAAAGGTAYLNRFAVAPVMRGQGLSARLAAELIAIARHRGDTSMSLWVYGSNHVARHLYEKLGFKVVDQRDADEDSSGVSINMRLELGQRAD